MPKRIVTDQMVLAMRLLWAKGWTGRAIAEKLHVKISTVYNYVGGGHH